MIENRSGDLMLVINKKWWSAPPFEHHFEHVTLYFFDDSTFDIH